LSPDGCRFFLPFRVNRVTAAGVYLCAMPEHQAGIRPLARAHREAAAALFAAGHPERADEPAGWGASRGPAGPHRYVAVVLPALRGRGRGIATALKVREVAAAQQRGVLTLDGATGNPAMLKVNERLGYRRTSTEVRLVRPL
jgi:GNAT superfamily N-acetyltransferase